MSKTKSTPGLHGVIMVLQAPFGAMETLIFLLKVALALQEFVSTTVSVTV